MSEDISIAYHCDENNINLNDLRSLNLVNFEFMPHWDESEYYMVNKGDIVFASVQMLGKKEYLNDECFTKDHFDYVVIDGGFILGLN